MASSCESSEFVNKSDNLSDPNFEDKENVKPSQDELISNSGKNQQDVDTSVDMSFSFFLKDEISLSPEVDHAKVLSPKELNVEGNERSFDAKAAEEDNSQDVICSGEEKRTQMLLDRSTDELYSSALSSLNNSFTSKLEEKKLSIVEQRHSVLSNAQNYSPYRLALAAAFEKLRINSTGDNILGCSYEVVEDMNINETKTERNLSEIEISMNNCGSVIEISDTSCNQTTREQSCQNVSSEHFENSVDDKLTKKLNKTLDNSVNEEIIEIQSSGDELCEDVVSPKVGNLSDAVNLISLNQDATTEIAKNNQNANQTFDNLSVQESAIYENISISNEDDTCKEANSSMNKTRDFNCELVTKNIENMNQKFYTLPKIASTDVISNKSNNENILKQEGNSAVQSSTSENVLIKANENIVNIVTLDETFNALSGTKSCNVIQNETDIHQELVDEGNLLTENPIVQFPFLENVAIETEENITINVANLNGTFNALPETISSDVIQNGNEIQQKLIDEDKSVIKESSVREALDALENGLKNTKENNLNRTTENTNYQEPTEDQSVKENFIQISEASENGLSKTKENIAGNNLNKITGSKNVSYQELTDEDQLMEEENFIQISRVSEEIESNSTKENIQNLHKTSTDLLETKRFDTVFLNEINENDLHQKVTDVNKSLEEENSIAQNSEASENGSNKTLESITFKRFDVIQNENDIHQELIDEDKSENALDKTIENLQSLNQTFNALESETGIHQKLESKCITESIALNPEHTRNKTNENIMESIQNLNETFTSLTVDNIQDIDKNKEEFLKNNVETKKSCDNVILRNKTEVTNLNENEEQNTNVENNKINLPKRVNHLIVEPNAGSNSPMYTIAPMPFTETPSPCKRVAEYFKNEIQKTPRCHDKLRSYLTLKMESNSLQQEIAKLTLQLKKKEEEIMKLRPDKVKFLPMVDQSLQIKEPKESEVAINFEGRYKELESKCADLERKLVSSQEETEFLRNKNLQLMSCLENYDRMLAVYLKKKNEAEKYSKLYLETLEALSGKYPEAKFMLSRFAK